MAATTVTYEKGKLYQLALTLLQIDPSQPRNYLDLHAQEEPTTSIARHGVLEPVLFLIAEGVFFCRLPLLNDDSMKNDWQHERFAVYY